MRRREVLSWSLGQLPALLFSVSLSLLLSFSAQRIFFTPFFFFPPFECSFPGGGGGGTGRLLWAQGYAHGMVLLTRALNGSNSTSLSRPLSPSRSGFPFLFLSTTRFSRTGSERGTDRPSVRPSTESLPLCSSIDRHTTQQQRTCQSATKIQEQNRQKRDRGKGREKGIRVQFPLSLLSSLISSFFLFSLFSSPW